MNKLLKYLTLAAAVAGLAVGSAYAVPTLTISDGTTTQTITDGSAGDGNSNVGAVTWVGSVGAWTLNVDTGSTKPYVGSVSSPQMDLSFLAGSNAAGTLTITFTDWGFVVPNGQVNDMINGNSNVAGTVTDNVIKNWGLASAQNIVTLGPLNDLSFTSTGSGHVVLGAQAVPNDSLSIQVVITHNGAGLTSGDKLVTVPVPDGGTTAVLLGLGLLGVGFVARRFKSVKA